MEGAENNGSSATMKPTLDVSKLFPGRSQKLRDLAQKVIERKAHPSELRRFNKELRRNTKGAFGKVKNRPIETKHNKVNK